MSAQNADPTLTDKLRIEQIRMRFEGDPSALTFSQLGKDMAFLLRQYDELLGAHDGTAARLKELLKSPSEPASVSADAVGKGAVRPSPAAPSGNGKALYFDAREYDEIYAEIKRRAISDPGVLQLLTARPELRVKIEVPVLDLKTDSLAGRMALLISQGFFKDVRSTQEVMRECVRRGWLGNKTPLNLLDKKQALGGLVEAGFLTLEPNGYQAVPGMKVSAVGA
jgi:hypothetical protein